MVEKIPFAIIFDDAVVSGPTHYRGQDLALIGEGAVGVIAYRITEQMTVAGGVREYILVAHLVHP